MKPTNSKKVIRMMGFDLQWWNGAMLWSIGLAFLAAAAVIISTTMVIKLRNKELLHQQNVTDEAIAAAKAEAEAARTEREKALARSVEADERAAAISQQAEDERLAQSANLARAQADIASANQRAVEVRQLAEAEMVKLNEELQSARAETAKANERAAEASQEANAERLERRKLETKVAPRRLDAGGIDQLSRHLSGLRGMNVDVIVYESLSPDASSLGSEIEKALTDAGMAVRRVNAIGVGAIVHGILVRCAFDSPSGVRAAASQLVAAIQSVGLSVELANPFPAGDRPAASYTAPLGTQNAELRVIIGAKE